MPISSHDVPEGGPLASEFPRPMGVHGAPHVGDAIVLPFAPKRIDLSLAATPATEDLRNALAILAPCDSLIGEAVTRLLRSALAKLESPLAEVK